MRIIPRYVLRHFLPVFVLSMVGFVGIYLMVDFFERVDNMLASEVPFRQIYTYFMYKIPLIVTQGIHDRFVAAVVDRLKALVVDDALKAGTQVGPVVDQNQLDQDMRYVGIGQKDGAKLVWGGERLNRATPGYYLAPALFTEARNDMTIAREEVFGPVAAVIRVKDYDEALAVANDTPFGLSAGICTTSLKYASHFKRNAEAGMVTVNLPTAGVDYHVPFGGRKASSYGPREQGRYAAEFFTTVKTAYVMA